MNNLVINSDISQWGFSSRWLSGKLSEMTGDLEVDISSYGGDVFEGIDMYNQLRRYSKDKGHVTTIAGSKVMSIASLLLLAGDTRKAHSNSTIMIHKAWTWLAGNSDELIAESKVLGGIDIILAKQYGKYMDNSHEEIMEVMSNEGWYIGQEQIEETNFIDAFIVESDEVEVSAKSNYKKAMARFSAKAQEDDVKPNFDEVKASIIECNDGKCPTASQGGKIANKIQGADMDIVFDKENLDKTEALFNALVKNKTKAEKDTAEIQLSLNTATTALEAKTEEMTKLVASHKTELSEAEGKLDSFKTETIARVQEGISYKATADVIVNAIKADDSEKATSLIMAHVESDGATRQTTSEPVKGTWDGHSFKRGKK